MRRSRIRAVFVLAVVALIVPAFVPSAGSTSKPALATQSKRADRAPRVAAPPRVTQHGTVVTGLRLAAPGGPCAGVRYEIVHGNRFLGCTHGPDPAPAGVDPSFRRTSPELRTATGVSPTGRTVPCIGDGKSGNRVQAVYAHLSSKPDRLTQFLPLIRTWAAQANETYNASAAETAGSRQIRFVTKNCLLSVVDKSIPPAAASNFGAEITALQNGGLKATNRKYLIWTDANSYCGLGQVFTDSTPSASNRNNKGPQYASVENGCWGLLGDPLSIGPASVEAHELTHALGAVQANAPRKSQAGHCTDEWEAMCYRDASATHLKFTCPITHSAFLDCGHNDYFSTNPPGGSYLTTHWNVAKNSFLIGSIAPGNDKFASATPIAKTAGIYVGSNRLATAETGEPATAASPGAHSIWYSVKPSTSQRLTVDTLGTGFDTVVGIYAGSSVGSLTLIGDNDDAGSATYSRAVGDLTANTTYFVKVDGKAAASGPIIVHASFTPTGVDMPQITNVSPTQGPAGTLITISGTGFDQPAFFAVEVNGFPVSNFGAVSATSIQVHAPSSVPDPGSFGADPVNVGSLGPITFLGLTGGSGPVKTVSISDKTFKYTV